MSVCIFFASNSIIIDFLGSQTGTCVYLISSYNFQNEKKFVQNNDVYDWSQEQQGIILSAFYWGFAITQIPAGILSQRYGGKYVFVLGILLSAVCSLLTPNVVQMGKRVKH